MAVGPAKIEIALPVDNEGASIAAVSNPGRMCTLSLILCSRNDNYMGNSRWRLQTTLNYVAGHVESLGRDKDVELLVADWGSEFPLQEVLQLTPSAAKITSFVLIPSDIARPLQKDSPFAEVLALNAAARRARGTYVGRIDQDTLVGRRFLEVFFELHEGRRKLEVPLDRALLFSNVRMVPYRFAVRSPSLWAVRGFVAKFGRRMKIEIASRHPFYWYSVGIWLVSRDIWRSCGGYDEEMLYMNGMEINMILRLLPKYPMVNLGEMTDCDFYHLEHYHPFVPRMSSIYRKVNREWRLDFNPNGADWGLAKHSLTIEPSRSIVGLRPHLAPDQDPHHELPFSFLVLLVPLQVVCDSFILKGLQVARALHRFGSLWWHRIGVG
jgi:hypothetical protein